MSQSQLFRLAPNSSIEDYLKANKEWALSTPKEVLKSNSKGQTPHTLWIGCADSRSSEFALKSLQPGEIFTHRNIANLINNPNDPSSKAIIKYAVEVLKVQKILIAGHTNCGGCEAVLNIKESSKTSLPSELEDWLQPLIDLKFKNLSTIEDSQEKNKCLSKLNVKSQCDFLINNNEVVQKAIKERGLEVHGLIYDVETGLLELCD